MRILKVFVILFFYLTSSLMAQTLEDDFEGAGNITSWAGDNCGINPDLPNPFPQGVNLSNTVLEYHDEGGDFANIRFDVVSNFDLSTNSNFKLKIYVQADGITGNQNNQVSLKLQDANIEKPWTTQSEIIKPIILNQWQEVTFDFENDAYRNLDESSLPPIERIDFNRVLIQINGEDNTDHVLAYIDDFLYEIGNTDNGNPIYDNLVWSDEFNGTGEIDAAKWFQQTKLIAGDSWANGELQHYTDRDANAYVSNGTLKIKAIGERYTDQFQTKNYTSARLNSKYAFKYGRVEVRAKLPSTAGTWPAIWLLGKNINEDGTYWDNEDFGTTPWPWCGEIDIMEPNVAKTEILATWHWDNGDGYFYDSKGIPTNNADTSQNFHDYILVWSPESMKIYMDTVLINEMPTIEPFNDEFFILLNVAMGGSLGGPVASGFTEDVMEIDYIRVYQENALAINQELTSPLVFYPNPVENTLNLKFKSGANQNIGLSVLDVMGRIVSQHHDETINKKLELDVTHLNQGIYFLVLQFDNGKSVTKKFVKK